MIEFTLVTILLAIVVLVIKPGRTPPLENPLTIERMGQFNAILAPRLNLAQPLLERISANLPPATRAEGNSNMQYYAVLDDEVRAHGTDHYLLAAMLHDGMLYFVACTPHSLIYDLNAITNETCAAFPSLCADDAQTSEACAAALEQAIQTSAGQRMVTITRLTKAE